MLNLSNWTPCYIKTPQGHCGTKVPRLNMCRSIMSLSKITHQFCGNYPFSQWKKATNWAEVLVCVYGGDYVLYGYYTIRVARVFQGWEMWGNDEISQTNQEIGFSYIARKCSKVYSGHEILQFSCCILHFPRKLNLDLSSPSFIHWRLTILIVN